MHSGYWFYHCYIWEIKLLLMSILSIKVWQQIIQLWLTKKYSYALWERKRMVSKECLVMVISIRTLALQESITLE